MELHEFFEGFSWAVPRAFAAAIDSYRFEEGDILYDAELAYQKTWADSLPHIQDHIQVTHPTRAPMGPVTGGEDASNWGSTVMFRHKDYGTGETRIVSSTQGRLCVFLVTGDWSILDTKNPSPSAWSLLSAKMLEHNRVTSWARANFLEAETDFCVFLMPHDEARPKSNRLPQLSEVLEGKFEHEYFLVPPTECEHFRDKGVRPTARIGVLKLRVKDFPILKETMKALYYKPSAKAKKHKEFTLAPYGKSVR